MHYADIYAAMVKAGHPPSKVADDLGVQRSAISQIIRGQASSRKIAYHISAVTGLPLNKMFPDGRYAKVRKSCRRAS